MKRLCILIVLMALSGCTTSVYNQESLKEPQPSFPQSLDEINLKSHIKYYYYDKSLSEPLAGVNGKLVWENNCLVFISLDGRFKTTPILPSNITQYDSYTQTFTIKDKKIKIGQAFSTNGSSVVSKEQDNGKCWQDTKTYIGTMSLKVI